ILRASGELHESAAAATLALDIIEYAPALRPIALAARAQAWLDQGRVGLAFADAAEAARMIESMGPPEERESMVRLVRAETLHATGDHDGARVAAEAAR